MDYYAHLTESRKQSVKEHLQGTAKLAEKFAAKFGSADWGYYCGLLHDMGKYSSEFQRKIQENPDLRVDHSTAGAQVSNELGAYYSLMSYCIAGHHAGLPDCGRKGVSASLLGRLEKDAIVEVAGTIGKNGAEGYYFGNIDMFYKGLMENQYAYESLTVDAFIEQDYKKALEALTLNRTVIDPEKAKAILDDFQLVSKDYWVLK